MEKKFNIGYKGRYMAIEEIKKYITERNYSLRDKRILEFIQGKRILDAGCNLGVLTCEIAKKNQSSEVIGIDNAEYLIEVANELYKDTQNLTYRAMDICKLDFADEEFDCVSFLETIEHLKDPVKAIKEIYRVLKLHGLLILSTNNVYYSRFLIRHTLDNFVKMKPRLMIHDTSEGWNRHIFCWDLSTLCTLLNENGFIYCDHFYTGSSGFYFFNSKLSRFIEGIFSKILPVFRATMVIKLRKARNRV